MSTSREQLINHALELIEDVDAFLALSDEELSRRGLGFPTLKAHQAANCLRLARLLDA